MSSNTGAEAPGFPIRALRSADLDVRDLAAAVAFFTETWGLHIADRQGASAWLRATGDDPHVLALHQAAEPRIRHFTLRATDAADLPALAAQAQAAGGTIAVPLGPIDDHGGGTGYLVRDRVGRMVRVVQGDARPAPLADDAERAERLSHVNFNSDDIDRDRAFYEAAFGMQMTDRSKMMAFLRTNADHHSIVIAEGAVNNLNHVAFNLPGWEGVMKASGRMVDAGFPIGWGPGRHGPGDNVFAYFVSPEGFVVEHTAEMLQVDARYRIGGPSDWTWLPGRTDHWGICPPKTHDCKAAQLAIPFA